MSFRDEALKIEKMVEGNLSIMDTRDQLLLGILCALLSIAYDVWNIEKNQ